MREKKLKAILKEVFGYQEFRFEQEKIINSILDGKDVVGIMPTGGGKSLCYQVPALYLDGLCLVISPLISLMQDQVMGLHEYGVRAQYINSSLSYEQKLQVKREVLTGKCKILYVAPEGIFSSFIYELLQKVNISLIAIDEAHCVSQWGHEFRKEYIRLGELKTMFKNVPTVALTATADKKTRVDIARELRLNNPNTFVSSFDRPNIKYMIHERVDEIKQLNNFISKNHSGETGVVYCLSRRKVEKTAEALQKLGYNAVAYHAGLSANIRSENQKRFTEEEGIIVVATIAFGMGIDRPDVRFVAHLDLPKSIEGYYQETGRAGRDGEASSAWMIYGLQDVVKLGQMLETTDAGKTYKKIARHKLDSMLSLCETTECRRTYLLSYFGEEKDKKCNYCDSCLTPAEQFDGTVDAQKVLSTIFKTGQFYGAGYVIDVLRGSKSAKILEREHHKLSVYGIGKDRNASFWNGVLRQLLNLGYIYIKNWDYRNLGLTEKSRDLLTGKKSLSLRKMAEKSLKKEKSKLKRSISQNLSEEQTGLFHALRELRSELAKDHKVPPYIIFSDKSLQEMALFKPQNYDDMMMVHGVGQTKFDKYGKVFIQAISAFE